MVIQSANGQLFTCKSCNKIHFEFLSVAIDFVDIKALSEFNEYLNGIDFDKYEQQNRDNQYRRKVVIPFPNAGIKMMLTSGEGKELVSLVNSFRFNYLVKKKKQRASTRILTVSMNLPTINPN